MADPLHFALLSLNILKLPQILLTLKTDSKKSGQDQKLSTNKNIHNFWAIIMKLGQKDHFSGSSFWLGFMMIDQKF